jgi:hypothetical protein
MPLKNTGAGDIVCGARGWLGGGTAVPGLTNSATDEASCALEGGTPATADTTVADDEIGLSFKPVYGVVSVTVPVPTVLSV